MRSFFGAVLLSTLAICPSTAVSQMGMGAFWKNPLSRGRVLLIQMNEASWNGTVGEANDNSGTGNNGQGFGSANTTASGFYGRGGSFNGTNSYVSVPNSTNLDIGATNVFTVAVRFKTSSASYQRIICKGQWVSLGFLIALNYTAGSLTYEFGPGNGPIYRTTASAYNNNAWHSVVVVSNGSTAQIYMDGVQAALTTTSLGPGNCSSLVGGNSIDYSGCTAGNAVTFSSTDPLAIGAYHGISSGDAEFFNGTIDEATIWNRALTVAEIKAY
jgi:hypothetical protein